MFAPKGVKMQLLSSFIFQDTNILFHIVESPVHGIVELYSEDENQFIQAMDFTMADIYEDRLTYSHDGSEEDSDQFAFTVSDGTNPQFVVQEEQAKYMTSEPQASPYIYIYIYLRGMNVGISSLLFSKLAISF